MTSHISPDLQSALMCEDVRQEAGGGHTLVGVLNVIPAPVVPIGLFKLCLWTRWCGGLGEFEQESQIIGCESDDPIAEARVAFRLPELDAHATNVHVFGGLQLPNFGVYRVEIKLDGELKLSFPLPVVQVQQSKQ